MATTAHIHEEVKRFAITTSMKGLPRVAKAQNCGCRAGWCLVVIAFLVVSLYQTSILVMVYLSHEKYTQIIEIPIDPLKTPELEVIPDVSICNLNPLTSNVSKYVGIPTYKRYQDKMVKFANCTNCSEGLKEKMANFNDDLLSMLGYLQYIGPKKAAQVGHQKSDFVVACDSYHIDGLKKKKVPCAASMLSTQFLNMDSFNCINMRVSSNTKNKALIGLNLVLYLDNFDEEIDYPYEAPDCTGQAAGAVYVLHEKQTTPFMQDGQMLMPGVFSTVRVALEHRERLGPPHGVCVDEYPNGNFIHVKEQNVYLRRSRFLCLAECLSDMIIKRCGCTDLHQLVPNLNESYPFCGDAKAGREDFVKRMQCASDLRSSQIGSCMANCQIPCKETFYKTELQQSIWPRVSHLSSFYNHYIADKPYRGKFKILKNLSLSNSSKQNILLAEKLVRDNFLQVSIYLRDFNYILLRDSPKADIASLLSQIGGTLNLWSGITVFILVEIFECIYRIATNCRCPDQEREPPIKDIKDVKE